MEIITLDVVGYKNARVPSTFIPQSKSSGHLGIILPGYHYSVDMAPLGYAGRVLREQGADLLRIEYVYYQTSFVQQPETEQDRWISSDVFAASNLVLSQRAYNKIALVGKSLGTIAMGHLLGDNRFEKAACVWLTPLLTVEWLRARIAQIHPRSLFVIGTADQFYRPAILSELEDVTNGRTCLIEGANHGLEIPGDISGTLGALHQMVQALQEFLDTPT